MTEDDRPEPLPGETVRDYERRMLDCRLARTISLWFNETSHSGRDEDEKKKRAPRTLGRSWE